MNSNGLFKARNVLLVLQILAAILTFIAAIVSFVSLNDIKTNYKSSDSFFGAVNTARVGAIIAFSISIITVIIAYFSEFAFGKAVGGAVISTVMFILNFVLVPFSSTVNLLKNASDISSFYPPMVILLIVSLIFICVSGASLNEQPAPEIVKGSGGRSIIPGVGDNISIDADSWTCSRCGTINPKSRPYCYQCSERRPPDEKEPPASEKICPFCGAKMSPDTSICWNCKKPYQPKETLQKCRFCGATIDADAEFCPKCGESTKSPNPTPVTETKQDEPEKTNICGECGAIVSGDGKFCGKCGKPIKPPVPPKKTKNICSCGAEIPAGNSFCGICGKAVSIEKTCPKCGAVIPPGNFFCGKCGEKVNSD